MTHWGNSAQRMYLIHHGTSRSSKDEKRWCLNCKDPFWEEECVEIPLNTELGILEDSYCTTGAYESYLYEDN